MDQPRLRAAAPSRNHYQSIRYVWYVVGLLTVVNVLNYMDRMALSVLAPYVKRDFDLSDAQLGLLTGLAFAIFYAVCAIPIARWADRGIRRDIIALALLVWSAMTALTGATQSFWQLFVTRVGVGAGEAGGLPPAQSLICDFVPLKRRPLVFAIHTFGLAAGMMLGMAIAGSLAEAIGWRSTFIVFGVIGIVVAVVVRFTLQEPQRGLYDAAGPGDILPFAQALGALWCCRTYRLLVASSIIGSCATFGLVQWWPSLYSRVYGVDLTSVGVSLGLAMGIGSAIGLLGGGALANKAGERDVRWPLGIGAAAFLFAVPAALGSIMFPSVQGAMVSACLMLLLTTVSSAPTTVAMLSVVPSRMRATAGAISLFCYSALGMGLGPLIVGILSDALMPELGAQSLRYAMLGPVCLMPIAVVLLYAATRTLPEDLKAAGAQGVGPHFNS